MPNGSGIAKPLANLATLRVNLITGLCIEEVGIGCQNGVKKKRES
jgi:hypothetical protein